jgi:hypothetical protein
MLKMTKPPNVCTQCEELAIDGICFALSNKFSCACKPTPRSKCEYLKPKKETMVNREMTLERQNAELMRRLAAREATIEGMARQLESAHGKAWEIEKLVIELGNQLKGGVA